MVVVKTPMMLMTTMPNKEDNQILTIRESTAVNLPSACTKATVTESHHTHAVLMIFPQINQRAPSVCNIQFRFQCLRQTDVIVEHRVAQHSCISGCRGIPRENNRHRRTSKHPQVPWYIGDGSCENQTRAYFDIQPKLNYDNIKSLSAKHFQNSLSRLYLFSQ